MNYPIDPSLRRFAHLPLPLWSGLLPIANLVLQRLPKGIRDQRIVYRRIVKPHWTLHMMTPKALVGQSLPCLYYIHGGGFVYHAAPHHYRMMKEYALRSSCTVVLMEYRLAPRYAHPLPIHDCVDGYHYLLDHAATLFIDLARIVLGGDSAGGFLALELTNHIQTQNLPRPRGLMLLYPVVDPSMSTPSMKRYVDTPLWNARHNHKMWNWYLKGAPLTSPLSYASLLSIPSCYLEVTEFDCLRDEGIALHQALPDSCHVQFHEVLRAYHGYDVVKQSPLTKEAISRRVNFIKDCMTLHS